jgi:sugar/nucleoside kinase (ribokinase family)
VNPVDLVSIGNALVDVLGHAEETFLSDHSLVKGSMELIDSERAVPLYQDMAKRAFERGDELIEVGGGSAANTAVVSAVLGTPTAFVGKVRDDELGHTFVRDLGRAGVSFPVAYGSVDTVPTGRCLINVTPDAERTLCTFLGAARGLRASDMNEQLFAQAKVTYVEGYLWDEELAHPALESAIEFVKRAGKRVSFTLSDSFLIDRFRSEFLELIPSSVDILFANEREIMSLFETDNFDEAVSRIGAMCEIATITRGKHGSIVVHDGVVEHAEAAPVPRVLDTTGAGDAYAGGFLAAFCQGLPLQRCAEVGNIAAGDVIAHLGARPTTDLPKLVFG